MSENNNNQKRNDNDVSQYYPSDETYNDNDDVFYSYEKNKKNKSKFKIGKFSSSQLILLAVIFVVYTAVIFTAAWLIFYRPAQPNELPFETNPPESSVENNNPPLDNKDPDETGNNGENPFETASPEQSGSYVAKEGVYNILLIGRDSAATLADVIMLINMDTVKDDVTIMQIPRDTLVNINVPTNKANAAYSSYVAAAVNAGNKNAHKTAMDQYKTLLEKNLCIEIHHAAVINLDAFVTIVDLFEGVDLYIPEAMEYEDPAQDLYINIPAGQQHLDGYNSMCFVRFRSGFAQADLGRVNAQKIFMTAFLQKVKSKLNLTNLSLLNQVANTIYRNVVTDMSVSDIIYYGKELLGMDLGSIVMLTLPGNIETGSAYYVINREAVLNTINEHFNIYTKNITDSIFDRNLIFCDSKNENICNIYYADAEYGTGDVYNAEEISSGSIHIPRVPAAE